MNGTTNPYVPDRPVDDGDMLYGREAARLWTEQQLALGRRLLIVYGPERIGKTSFLRCLPQYLPGEVRCILFDCGPFRQRGLEDCLEALFSVVSRHLLDWSLIGAEEIGPAGVGAAATATLLRDVQPRLDGSPICLALDNADTLGLMAGSDRLASSFDILATLLAAVPDLRLLLSFEESFFHRFDHSLMSSAETFHLGAINSDAAQLMITRPGGAGIRHEPGAVKRVVDIASNHPYYLQLFGRALHDRCCWSGVLNQNDVDAVLEDLLGRLDAQFRVHWDRLLPADQAVAMAVAGIKGTHDMTTQPEIVGFLQRIDETISPKFIRSALDRLVDGGVLVQMGAMSYRFAVNLFRLWIERQFDAAIVLSQVDWDRLPAAVVQGTRAPDERKAGGGWGTGHWITLLLALTATMGVALWVLTVVTAWPAKLFLPTPTPAPVADLGGAPPPTATPSPTPVPLTPTPTKPIVVARTIPSIAFRARNRNLTGDLPTWQIFVMNADGTGRQRVSFGDNEDISPVWSPDGNRIAFVSKQRENRDIWVLDVGAGNLDSQALQPMRITDNPAHDWTASWSPDGERIVFTSNRAGNWQVFVADADGTGIRQITEGGEGILSPVWSPDGKTLAYSGKAGEYWHIFTMPAPDLGAEGSSSAKGRQLTSGAGNDLSPAYSPRGDQIVFQSNRDGNAEIYVMNSDGSGERNLSNNASADDHGPVWAPDGKRLLFYSSREGNWDIFQMSDDGKTVTNLSNSPDIDEQEPSWRP